MNLRNIINFSKKIEADNKAFASLTPKQQRLAIAKDALAQLVQGKAIATSGVYCRALGTSFRTFASRDEIATKLKATEQCRVCAKGALFLSSFRLDSEFDPDVSVHGDEYLDGANSFESVFDQDTMNLAEMIFEDTVSPCGDQDDAIKQGFVNASEDRANGLVAELDYELQFIGDEGIRLFGILTNIIENNGNFKPLKARSLKKVKAFVKSVTTRHNNAISKYYVVEAA